MMNKFCLKTIEFCPLITLMFSLSTVAATTILNDIEISPIYAYLCVQVYFNWYSINRISRALTTIVTEEEFHKRKKSDNRYDVRIEMGENRCARQTTNEKLWYCEKCAMHTIRPSRHCAICKKCFHHRDHHCFFIGSCIVRQNMGNFILICVYTSLSSIYSLSILTPYLYEHLNHFLGDNSTVFDIIMNFSLPVALARFFFTGQESCIVLVALFDALLSVASVCLVYGLWKFYACLTGRQRYFHYVEKKHDLIEVFGSYGLWNIVFPINGLQGAKSLAQEFYAWKEI